MPVTVTAEPLDMHVDARDVVQDLVTSLTQHWTSSLLAGQRAGGGALPNNSKGQPYGLGDGSIATDWETTTVEGNEHQASATSSPDQHGGHFYVVRNMVAKGFNPASVEGEAAVLIDAGVQRAADRVIDP